MATPEEEIFQDLPDLATAALDVPIAAKRNIRIGNVSGATGDAPHALARMVREGDVDVITGDWLSEMSIAWNAIADAENPDPGYKVGFLDQLSECIEDVVANGIKIVTNAGAFDAAGLSQKVDELCKARGHHDIIVATIVGDDVSRLVESGGDDASGLKFRDLDHEEQLLENWDPQRKPTSAVACIGAWGIATALKEGADIVICGRMTGASPVIGAAAWWYSWSVRSYRELAGALVAGHLIECRPYASGANFPGFKQYLPGLVNLAFLIAEIHSDGTCFITKPETMGGTVNKSSITAQLLDDLQGELYLSPDVVADLSRVSIVETGEPDTVYVSGAVGRPPPPTTTVMIAAPGGYHVETTYYINGLDVSGKAQMMKDQLEYIFRDSKFSRFSAEAYGTQAQDPSSQKEGTVMLRVVAQARRKEDLGADKFRIPLDSMRRQSYPGCHLNLDFRSLDPRPILEILTSLIPQSAIEHRVLIPKLGKSIPIAPPTKTAEYPVMGPSYETAAPVDLVSFGGTVREPLGYIVHARSGDEADNANVGFFVRYRDEYSWLQSLLTVEKLKELLGKDFGGQRIERVELPLLWAVHFRIIDFVDSSVASSARIDGLGKGVGEYLRSRHVEVPVRFLQRGRI